MTWQGRDPAFECPATRDWTLVRALAENSNDDRFRQVPRRTAPNARGELALRTVRGSSEVGSPTPSRESVGSPRLSSTAGVRVRWRVRRGGRRARDSHGSPCSREAASESAGGGPSAAESTPTLPPTTTQPGPRRQTPKRFLMIRRIASPNGTASNGRPSPLLEPSSHGWCQSPAISLPAERSDSRPTVGNPAPTKLAGKRPSVPNAVHRSGDNVEGAVHNL